MLSKSFDKNTGPIIDALGRPLHDLRISVTDKCNLNCTYCMPNKNIVFLPQKEILSFEEITEIVEILRDFGVKKIKLTGGEPTLRLGLDILIKKLTQVQGIEDIGLITNGIFLKTLGTRLHRAGLKRISISVDALDPRLYQTMVGNTHSLHPVLEGIDYAKKIGFSPIKVNCVIQKGVNENQVYPMIEYFKQRDVHLRFIEFMDVGSIDWEKGSVVSSHTLLKKIKKKYHLEAVTPAYRGEVATRYKHTDSSGELGFISSVSQPFCKDCNRLRLTADGFLYGCLFAPEGINIKKTLRNDGHEALKDEIKNFWTNRNDRYSEIRMNMRNTNRRNLEKQNMHFIGG